MSEEIEREYPYRAPRTLVTLIPLFFGLLCGGSIWMALTNERGILCFNLFFIDPLLARILMWLLTALFGALFVGVLPFVVNALTQRQRIAFTSTALLVPKHFLSSADRVIPYRDIVELTLHTDPQGTRSWIIRQRQGKFVIVDSWLPSNEAFEEVSALLRERICPSNQ